MRIFVSSITNKLKPIIMSEVRKDFSEVALATINALNEAKKNSPTGTSFVSIKGYENSQGEVSNVIINVGVSYENALKKDVKYLEALTVEDVAISEKSLAKIDTEKNDLDELKQNAIDGLLKSAKASLERTIAKKNGTLTEEQKNEVTDPYVRLSFAPQIKIHKEDGTIMLDGYRVSKNVLKAVEYAEKNQKALTIVKDAIRKNMKTNTFRNYKFDSMNNLTLSGTTIEFIDQTI